MNRDDEIDDPRGRLRAFEVRLRQKAGTRAADKLRLLAGQEQRAAVEDSPTALVHHIAEAVFRSAALVVEGLAPAAPTSWDLADASDEDAAAMIEVYGKAHFEEQTSRSPIDLDAARQFISDFFGKDNRGKDPILAEFDRRFMGLCFAHAKENCEVCRER